VRHYMRFSRLVNLHPPVSARGAGAVQIHGKGRG
jgi:hypothetical protein